MAEWARDFGLLGLFVSAFVSSTLAPGGSEVVLAYMAGSAHFGEGLLLGVATLGNTLGSLTTWALGALLARRHPPAGGLDRRRARAIARVRRWGWPVLALSWLPVVGDGFCFAAGWLQAPFWKSLFAIATGKALRYAAILWVSRTLVVTPAV